MTTETSILRSLGLMLAQEEGEHYRRPRPFNGVQERAQAQRNMHEHYRHWWMCRSSREVIGQRNALEGMRRCRHVIRICTAMQA